MFGNKTAEADAIDILLQNIQFYYAPILVYLGFLGNCLSICVFLGTKLRHFSSNIYLVALAISDTGYLVVVFVLWLKMVDIDLWHHSCFCKFFMYLSSLCSFLSVWFVVAFTIERFMAIKYPLHCHSICTVTRAKMIVIGLLGLGLLLCSPIFLFVAPQSNATENVTECDLIEEWKLWANIYNIIDTVLTLVLPFIIIVILNALIARNIYKLGRIRRTLTVESNISSGKDIYAQNLQSRISQTKITKMLLIVSSVFLCFNLPAYVMRMFAFFQRTQNGSRTVVLAQQMCNLLFYTNFGINFILYCASGQNFRRAMVHMFTCRSRKRNKTFMQMTTHGKQYISHIVSHKYSSTKRSDVIDNKQ